MKYFYNKEKETILVIDGANVHIFKPMRGELWPSETVEKSTHPTPPIDDSDTAPARKMKRAYVHKDKKGRKGKTCGNCGEPGHNKKTCTNEKSENDGKEESGPSVSLSDAMKSVTRESYNGVKKLQEMEYNALEAHKESGISMTIINRIFSSYDYDGFHDEA